MPHINIEFKGNDLFVVQFKILSTPIGELWLERWNASDLYPLDNPTRFHGFNSAEQEKKIAKQFIQQCITTINEYQPIVKKLLTDINDQDTLNYLHNIFEKYHGLLNDQDNSFWLSAPVKVRQALANLNIAVHRCEAAEREPLPKLVCTWWGLPKTKTLDVDIMRKYGQLTPRFGTICLNYAEIGKTLLDLTLDSDKYIGDDAFKPFNHYSSDFVIRFYEFSAEEITKKILDMNNYYNQHLDFFHKKSYNQFNDPRLLPLYFPVAHLVETMSHEQLIQELSKRQYVNRVWVE